MNELIGSLKDSTKRDKNELVGKISSFTNEYGPRIFDKDTFNFVKDKVRTNWNQNVKRTNELER